MKTYLKVVHQFKQNIPININNFYVWTEIPYEGRPIARSTMSFGRAGWAGKPAPSVKVKRLGLVVIEQMLTTLVAAVENPPSGVRVVEVPEILLPQP